MTRIGSIFKNRTTRTLALAATTAAGLIAFPAFASAASRDHRSHDDVRVDINLGAPATHYEDRSERVWVEPVYQTVTQRVWIAPSYQTVSDRVWVDGVTRDDCVRVYVPDRFEIRDVEHGDRHHRWTTREQVLVEPGHYVDQHQQVVVSEGHWEMRDRQVATPGHWEDVQQQQLVSPGHYELRTDRVRVEEPRDNWFSFFGRFGR